MEYTCEHPMPGAAGSCTRHDSAVPSLHVLAIPHLLLSQNGLLLLLLLAPFSLGVLQMVYSYEHPCLKQQVAAR